MLRSLVLVVAIVYTIALLIATFGNVGSVVPTLGSSFDDKILHVLAYFGLAMLWVNYFKPNKKKFTFTIVFSCLIAFGIILEITQYRLNSKRMYDNLDLIANCFGVVIGTVIANRLNIIKY